MRLRNTYKNIMEHGMKEGILDSDWKAVLHFWRRMIAKVDAMQLTSKIFIPYLVNFADLNNKNNNII